MPLAQIDLGLIMRDHAGEGIKPEGAERQRQDDGIARPALGMGERRLQRLPRFAGKRKGQRFDMARFPFGAAFRDFCLRLSDPASRFGEFGMDRVQPRPRRVGQGEIRVGIDRRVQLLRRARPQTVHQGDAFAIMLRRFVRCGGKRELVAVDIRHRGSFQISCRDGHSRFACVGLSTS